MRITKPVGSSGEPRGRTARIVEKVVARAQVVLGLDKYPDTLTIRWETSRMPRAAAGLTWTTADGRPHVAIRTTHDLWGLARTIIHEFVHVKQVMEGRLRDPDDGKGTTIWEGKLYEGARVKLANAMAEAGVVDPRDTSPWEYEAYTTTDKVIWDILETSGLSFGDKWLITITSTFLWLVVPMWMIRRLMQ